MPKVALSLDQQRHEQLIKALGQLTLEVGRLANALETVNLKTSQQPDRR